MNCNLFFEKCSFIFTSGAREPLLDSFSEIFDTLNLEIKHFDGEFDCQFKAEMILFIEEQLKFNHSRRDYKELLLVARKFLILISCNDLVKPVRYNHSRFMKQLTICFLIYLF